MDKRLAEGAGECRIKIGGARCGSMKERRHLIDARLVGRRQHRLAWTLIGAQPFDVIVKLYILLHVFSGRLCLFTGISRRLVRIVVRWSRIMLIVLTAHEFSVSAWLPRCVLHMPFVELRGFLESTKLQDLHVRLSEPHFLGSLLDRVVEQEAVREYFPIARR